MLDLVAVLEWVRTHISMFGGDPNNVTIFGQSGGGGKVAALLAMPAAKGLFHRAIIQSGPFVRALSQDYSHRVADTLLAELGLQKSDVRKLQKIPVDQLSGVAAEAIRKTPQPLSVYRDSFGESGWGPTVDGHSLAIHPFDPGAPAISAEVPLITGANLNESVSALDHPGANAMTAEEMTQRIHEMYGSDADAIIAAYKDDLSLCDPIWSLCDNCDCEMAHPGIQAGVEEGRIGRCARLLLHLFLADAGAGQSPRHLPCV